MVTFSNFHGVAAFHDINVSALRTALNGGGGNDDQVLFDVDEQMNVHELIGKKNVVLVVENGFEFVGASGGIDLVVDRG